MRLAHLHLPALTCYRHASCLQETLVHRHFQFKDSLRSSSTPSPSSLPQPDPTILTFSTLPTYTVGRRYLSSASSSSSAETKSTYHISPTQQSFLQGLTPTLSNPHPNPSLPLAEFHSTTRGGDLTFHGPGQLVAYPVIDLRRHRITPRNYIRLLENTVMATCARFGVSDTTTTENPGVWIRGGERKICAVGVQVRRGISGHGIGLNVRDQELENISEFGMQDVHEGGGMLSWGFGRIVACGLQGKSVTWLTKEGARTDLDIHEVATTFVEELARGLGDVDEIYNIDQQALTKLEAQHAAQRIQTD